MGQNITCDECGREHPQAMSAQQQGKDEDGAERLRSLCFLCARALPPDGDHPGQGGDAEGDYRIRSCVRTGRMSHHTKR